MTKEETFLDRLKGELAEVETTIEKTIERANKLIEYMDNNPHFKTLDAQNQSLLRLQWKEMDVIIEHNNEYASILKKRIEINS